MKIVQGFSNSVTARSGMRKSEIIVWGGMIKFASFKPFPRVLTTICKYRILTKTKISMICVCKEYESKMKILQEQ